MYLAPFFPDHMMSEVYVRTTDTFNDVNGGWNDINSGNYGVSTSSFNPTSGDLCATITNIADLEIRELYCQEMSLNQFVVLHTTGQRLQFCEIQVYDNGGKKIGSPKENTTYNYVNIINSENK